MSPAEIRAMNERIAQRWQKANAYPTVPIQAPSWAASVVDAAGELVAVHKETGAPFPIDLHKDLDPEDRAIVVARRILGAGGSVEEIVRFFDSFELPQYARDRLVRDLHEATQ